VARIKRSRIARFLILVCLPLLFGAAANRDLEGLKKKIESEKKDLSRLQHKESSVAYSLSKIKSELTKRNKEIERAGAKLSSITGELKVKQAEAERLADSIAARLAMLQKRAAALYRWNRSGSSLVLLNGNVSPNSFMQRQHYLAAALAFDRELLAELAEEGRRQAELHEELAQKREELAEQKTALGNAKEAIRHEAQKKQLLLASLRREKGARTRALQQMEAAARRLEKMMEEIARRAMLKKPGELPPAPAPGIGLGALRGRLEWPVRGQVTAPFGKFRHPEFDGEILRKGIDIETALGEEIRVVEKGRVVYADRFSGYGKMVIVDHGERYYTIYGHLSEILTKVGEAVTRGEALGRAGDADAPAGAKLYFEIRKDGHSVDPQPWFRKR
jgi:septal ring factor EnvC (AmiA/AmiB activator)